MYQTPTAPPPYAEAPLVQSIQYHGKIYTPNAHGRIILPYQREPNRWAQIQKYIKDHPYLRVKLLLVMFEIICVVLWIQVATDWTRHDCEITQTEIKVTNSGNFRTKYWYCADIACGTWTTSPKDMDIDEYTLYSNNTYYIGRPRNCHHNKFTGNFVPKTSTKKYQSRQGFYFLIPMLNVPLLVGYWVVCSS